MIRVVLADDQTLVRAGFRALLERADDIEVVGEAEDGAAAFDLVRSQVPDVVLMDIRMPKMDGIEATGRILATPGLQDVRVVILTTFDLDEYLFDALRLGASGFLLKDVEPDALRDAVRVVARATRSSPRPSPAALSPHLSRERRLVVHRKGSTPSQIASERWSRWSRRGSPTTRSPSASSSAPPPQRPMSAGR